VWRIQVAGEFVTCWIRNIADNVLQQDREITDQLYGGDNDKRIRQEIVLGIGGLPRAEGSRRATDGRIT